MKSEVYKMSSYELSKHPLLKQIMYCSITQIYPTQRENLIMCI